MKKKITAVLLCACGVLGVAGCGASGTSSWKIMAEKSYDFNAHIFGYYDADTAISVGYAGEIHYLDTEDTEWPMADNSSMCRFGLDIVDGNICYTCGNAGNVTKSTDGGKTFELTTDFGDSEPDECQLMSFADENNGIIASKDRLAITADGAESWTELSAPAQIACLKMADAKTLCFVGTDLIFYKTIDGGANRSNVPLNLPGASGYCSNIQNLAIGIDGEDSYTVFCIDGGSCAVKSFTTTDNRKTCMENVMPDMMSFMGYLYLNHDGTILTVTDPLSGTATAIKKIA